MRRLLVAMTASLVVASPPLLAWHWKGHMAVAAVAYQLLKASIRARVDDLLTRNPSIDVWRNRVASAPQTKRKQLIFMLASCGPTTSNETEPTQTRTTLKPVPELAGTSATATICATKYWHFVDTPFSDDGTALTNPATVNAHERIELFRRTLSSSEGDDVKSYDLVWLEHLAGDVYQPLHCTSVVKKRFGVIPRMQDSDPGKFRFDFRTYLCSFCGAAEALHWLHYGRSGTGVAVGFDSIALSQVLLGVRS